MASSESLFERVSQSFSELTLVAADLNTVSDELGRYVVQIDESLKKLNLGISVWVEFREWHDDQVGDYTADRLGYAKTGNRWGISLQKAEGNYCDPDQERPDTWLFSDAPRALRLAAIDHIPAMLDKLAKEASNASKNIKAKMPDVRQVASAMSPREKGPFARAVESARANAVATGEIIPPLPVIGGAK